MQNASTLRRSSWTILEMVKWASGYFSQHQLESARSEAEILLAHCLGIRRIDLYLNHDKPLSASELKRFKAIVKRRMGREPVAYITGIREFWSLEMAVNPSVLIPRPETECLVEAVLPFLDHRTGSPQRVLDMGTGSGAIVIALAHEHPEHRYLATDQSVPALHTARENARRHDVAHRIWWVCGNWDAPLAWDRELFDVIVSNPPYIRSEDMDALQPEIRGHEPATALDGSSDGLKSMRQIIASAHRCLKRRGHLALEIGFDQAEAVQRLSAEAGLYGPPRIIKDHSARDRVLILEKR